MPKQIKIGHIGCGYWGKNIIRTLHNMNFLAGVADTSEESIQNIKTEISESIQSLNPEEIIACKEIQAITLATPAETQMRFSFPCEVQDLYLCQTLIVFLNMIPGIFENEDLPYLFE